MSLTGSLLDGNSGSGTSYKGAWDASTNTPTLINGTGAAGDYYIVSVAGTQDLGSGSIAFTAGDQAIYSGTIWQKIEGGVDYVPEDVANKAINFSTENDTLYPSVLAVKNQLDLKISKVAMTDNAVPRANGTDGTLQNSTVTISDLGVIAAGGFSSTGSIGSDSSISAGGTLNVSKFVAGNSRLQVSNFDFTSTSDATFDMYAAAGNVTQAFSNNSNDVVLGLDKADNNFKMTWDYNFSSGFFLKVNPSGQINLPLIAASKSLGLDAQNNIVGVDAAYGHVTGITTQSIPHATGVNLTTYWNGTPTLSGGVSFASGVFTVTTAGFYQIAGSFSFTTNGAGARSANVRVNNSALISYQNIAPVSNDRTGMNASAGIYLNAGDNVRILAYQGSGVTLNTDGAIGGNFSITKTGN